MPPNCLGRLDWPIVFDVWGTNEEQNYSVHEKVTLNYNHYYIFTSFLAPKESHPVVFLPRPGWRKRGESTAVFLPPSVPYAVARWWFIYHTRVGPHWMKISDVHETHQCKISWLAVSKITTNEITAVSELVVWTISSYDVCKGEDSENCWGIGLACTNAPEQVVMMQDFGWAHINYRRLHEILT